MKEIICPHCKKVFSVDDESYESIAIQIRNNEFNEELHKRQVDAEKTYKQELEAKLAKAETLKVTEVTELKAKISNLEAKISSFDLEKKSAINDAIAIKDKELTKKDAEIASLKSDAEKAKLVAEKELQEKLSESKDKIKTLEFEMNNKETTFLIEKQGLVDQYETKIKQQEEAIAYYKDFKAKLSTKMVGESLEVFCKNEVEKIMGFLPSTVEFVKDNETVEGSKGDFVYREFSPEGVEILSIMFEMKNENDTSSTKKKNEDFFEKLDSDRKKKNCEYAVLVSLLELDNDYYNVGIVDVNHKYNKMYVIRPQCLVPMINILRGTASKVAEYKVDLERAKNTNLDIANFENKLLDFQSDFGKNYQSSQKNFEEAIKEIDKAIADLNKVKSKLQTSENQLRLANNKLQDLTIKKLTRNNKTMKELFNAIDAQGEEE